MQKILSRIPARILGLVALSRNLMYERRWLGSVRFDFPVVCIGNLSAGGTGKTPLTEWLAFHLGQEFKVASLSRGYGRRLPGFREVQAGMSADEAGDEPLQLKERVPFLRVFVGEDRVLAVPRLLQEYPDCDLILLDDAFQHRRIRAGFNILLTRYDSPYFQDAMFPEGMLREPAEGAKRADVIVVSNTPEGLNQEDRLSFQKMLNTAPHQKVYFSSLVYTALLPAFGTSSLQAAETASDYVLLTGIAEPGMLKARLEQSGKRVHILRFPDHHRYDRYDLERLRELLGSLPAGCPVITTWKDAERLKPFASWFQENKIPVYVQPVSIIFADGQGQELLHDLKQVIARLHPNHSINEGN
jgi:tetraacyldisaccharide 4'-kinase